MSLLTVEQLSVRYGDVAAVDDLSFTVAKGESVGLVGESGSGKSQTALAVLGLLPRNASVTGSIRFAGDELIGKTEAELNDMRASKVAMVFQDPLQALNPFMSIGAQLSRILLQHRMATGVRCSRSGHQHARTRRVARCRSAIRSLSARAVRAACDSAR